MLFDYISELSVKLLDAVATRQVGGRECTSNGALIKHSQDASFSLCWIKKKVWLGMCFGKHLRGCLTLSFPHSHPELLWPYKAVSRHQSRDPGSPGGEPSVPESHDIYLGGG